MEGITIAKITRKHLSRTQVNLLTLSKQQVNIIEETYSKWESGQTIAVIPMEMWSYSY